MSKISDLAAKINQAIGAEAFGRLYAALELEELQALSQLLEDGAVNLHHDVPGIIIKEPDRGWTAEGFHW